MKLVHKSERNALDNSKTAGYFITPNGTLQPLNNTTATATTDGLTTGILASAPQYVTVTSSAATNKVTLPQASMLVVGTTITGFIGANGFKLGVSASDSGTVSLNNVSTAGVFAAIPANTFFDVILINPTTWILFTITALGGAGTAIVPA